MSECPVSPAVKTSSRRLPLLLAGYGCFALGVLGLFLPVMPTTIFWIIAAVCFAKSSPAMYARIVNHPRLGESIRLYMDEGRICRGGKIAAFTGMGIGAGVLLIVPVGLVVSFVGLAVIGLSAFYVGTRPGNHSV